MLVVHGYTDYFFNTELADHFAARGFAFYALDLHKCGRSWREGQTPHFTTDLARYDAELERALDLIARRGAADVLVYGHSAGGLIVALWLDRLRRRGDDREASHHRPGAQQPVASICTGRRSCAPRRTGAAIGAIVTGPQDAGAAPADRGWLRRRRCTATTAATSTTT